MFHWSDASLIDQSKSSSDAPWGFTEWPGSTNGIVAPGLMRVRNEIWDETDLDSWPSGGVIAPDTNNTLYYIEFTISNTTISAEWKSDDDSGGGAHGFPEGELGDTATPTHIVPILEFTLNATNETITSWIQHQWGNISLPRL